MAIRNSAQSDGMSNLDILDQLKLAIINGDSNKARTATEKAIERNIPPYDIFEKSMVQGMNVVGEKFRNYEYFVADLVLAGEALREALQVLDPILRHRSEDHTIGKIIIGSVEGDIHDLGKNIVIAMLIAAGFEVIDLGIDVPEQKYIDELVKNKPDILAASAYISSTINKLETLERELERRNLRNSVKYLVGGAAVTKRYAESIGADGYGKDAMEAVEVAKNLLRKEAAKNGA
jgi:5-methyltetrahydrofolate--homocysteine methyltransferase